MSVLGEYHRCLGNLIDRYDGTLERFIGDGLLVVFNDPIEFADHTERAVKMSLAMRDAVNELVQHWATDGHSLGFGIGIERGHATVGEIGFDRRSDYAVIGSVPNLAARLCEVAASGQVLIGPRVFKAIEQQAETVPMGDLSLKGFHRPIRAFDVSRWIGG
jgi:class 3 adenylate cyclase